ncbi:MAG: leucine-rich repeat protein [Ruminococcus sp.]
MKRSISLLLAFLLSLSMFSALTISSSADTFITSSDGMFMYTLTDNKVKIKKCLDTDITDLNIPETIDGYTVTGIFRYILDTNNSVKTLTIPETVTEIEDYAFRGWMNVETLNYNAVNATAYNAFYNFTGLKTINFGENVVAVPNNFCQYAHNVKTLNLNDKLQSIGNYAFRSCGFRSVKIPETVKYIGVGAFYDCSYLSSVNIPKGVDTLSSNIFHGCRNLKQIDIPENIKSIGKCAFENSGLESIAVPDTVEYLGENVFYNCSKLTSAVLPKGITKIPKKTFSNCIKLSSFVINSGVTQIGEGAFSGCNSLGDVVIPNTVTSIGKGAYYSADVNDMTIPSSVKEIGSNAFDVNSAKGTFYYDAVNATVGEKTNYVPFKFSRVVIGDNVQVLPKDVFYDSSKVTEISFGKNVREMPKDFLKESVWYKSLPDGAVVKDNILLGYKGSVKKDLVIGKNVSKIASYAFSNSAINSVTVQSNVKYIGSYAFSDCQYLNYASLPNTINAIEKGTFYNCSNLKEFSFPSSVKMIEESAFENCEQMKISAYPMSVERIGKSAFKGCKKLSNFNFGNSLTKIEDYAFADCTKLTISKYSNKLSTIGDYAFSFCTGLKEFNLTNSVKTLGDYSFYNCSSLSKIKSAYSLKAIGNSCFNNCYSLNDFEFSSFITEIPESSFKLCRALKTIYIPDNITKIGKEAFYKTGITKVSVPSSVTTIEEYVFTPDGSVSVYGKSGSKAESYCKDYGYTFVESVSGNFSQTVNLRKGNTFPLDLENIIYAGSNDQSVATVDREKITAKDTGSTTVIVRLITGEVYEFNVSVIAPKLSATGLSLEPGGAKSLTVTNGTVKSWSTSDNGIFTVKNGRVTALDKGSATITATLVTGEKLTCKVTVKSSPKLSRSNVTVKKGKTARITLSGKVSAINNKYTNTKYAKFTSKANAKTLTIKGLKKGKTTLKVRVNGVKTLNVKVTVK